MSYDLYLNDPVTGKVCQVNGHLMHGGTYRADYDPATGQFSPALETDAHLNITYNYARYYYEATYGDERFEHDDGNGEPQYGIRGIYGKTGSESVLMIMDMIGRIRERYHDGEKWLDSERERSYWLDGDGNRHEIDEYQHILLSSIFHSEIRPDDFDEWVEQTETYIVNEGDCSHYWDATAANAIRPLHQLIALAQMRPDGIWDGD